MENCDWGYFIRWEDNKLSGYFSRWEDKYQNGLSVMSTVKTSKRTK